MMGQSKLTQALIIFLCLNLAINVDFVRSEESKGSWWKPARKLVCFSAIVGVILSSPILLSALGFTATGITAGSVAAQLMAMGLFTKGSILAMIQSMVMKGKITGETAEYLYKAIKYACVDD